MPTVLNVTVTAGIPAPTINRQPNTGSSYERALGNGRMSVPSTAGDDVIAEGVAHLAPELIVHCNAVKVDVLGYADRAE